MTEHVRDIEATPDLDDLLQEEPLQLATVPVRVEGATLTQELPSRYVQTNTYADVVATAFERIASATDKRKSITLVSVDGVMWVRSGGLEGAVWPQGVPCVMTHTEDVSIKADTGTIRVGCIQEFWAD